MFCKLSPLIVLTVMLWARPVVGEPEHRLKPEASLRLRSQLEWFDTAPYRFRVRLRARTGATIAVGSGIDIGGRLTTGSEDPTSSQLTLGNEFDKQPLKLDRLFMRLRRGDWLTLSVGKVPAEFRNRRLIWDRDVSPEGATQALKLGCVEGLEARFTIGEYMLVEVEEAARDPLVLVAQGGLEMRRGAVDVGVDLAVHEYSRVSGLTLTYADGSNTIDADGHLVGSYRLIDALLEVSVDTSFARLGSYVELTRNIGMDRDRDAVAIGVELERALLEIGYEFRRVERDAIIDALAETAWYVRKTGFLGHKLSVKRTIRDTGWTLGAALSWMRSIAAPAEPHVDGSLTVEWAL